MTTTTTKVLGTGEVAASLEDDSPFILKVDEDTEAYNRGHVPGALAVHWRQHDLQDPIRRQFIGSEAFTTLMDRLGGGNDTQVALYGGNNKARPLTDEVLFAGGTVSLDAAVYSELRAFRDQVLARLHHAALVDVCSPEEYWGEKLAPDHLPQDQAHTPGHIPGAANITWSKAVNQDGTFRSADDLRALYEEAVG